MRGLIKHEFVTMVLDILIIILLGILSVNFFIRIDMTTGASLSVQPVTQRLLQKLDDTLAISYFVSPELVSYTSGIAHIEAKLQEFAIANSFVSYTKRNPLDVDSEKNIESYGLVARQINIVRNNAEITTTVYSGIVLEYKGNKEIIPIVYEASNLEYAIASCISRLIFQQVRTVGLIISDRITYSGVAFSHIPQWLSANGVATAFVDADTDFTNLDAILVFGDDMISPEIISAVQFYCHNGGAVLLAISPSTVSFHSDWICEPIFHHGFTSLLRDFGVAFHNEMIQDISNVQLQLSSKNDTGFEYVDYPLWVQVLPSALNRDHLITKRLNGLTCFWPGYFSRDDTTDYTTKIVPLAYSSESSFLMSPPFNTNPYQQSTYHGQSTKSYCISFAATRIINGKEARLVAISDSLFVSDIIQVASSVHNLDYLSNAVEWLTKNDELLALKNCGAGVKRLNFNPADEKDVSSAFRVVVFCCIGIPLILVLFMVVLIVKRRRFH